MEPRTLEVHKALADDTRFRLYRYLRLSGRPVPVRELSTVLGLHPNTLRPHLRRLEEVGLVTQESRRATGVGRPHALYSVVAPDGDEMGEYRLLAEILVGLVRGGRATERARRLAREWGHFLVSHDAPKPGARIPAGRNLAAVQAAMARAGFDPRFRRAGGRVEVLLRDCPARDLAEDNAELVCALHRGLIEGMLEGVAPPLRLKELTPLADKGVCRVVAAGI